MKRAAPETGRFFLLGRGVHISNNMIIEASLLYAFYLCDWILNQVQDDPNSVEDCCLRHFTNPGGKSEGHPGRSAAKIRDLMDPGKCFARTWSSTYLVTKKKGHP